MTAYTTPLNPPVPHTTAGPMIPSHGELKIAESPSTAPKCTIVGVAKASPASALFPVIGLSEMRLITTNCKPMRAPADDPTIT